MSEYTKMTRLKYWLYKIIDWIILFVPLIATCFVSLFRNGATTHQKVALIGSVLIALILVIFNLLAQKKLRCPLWIVMIGLYLSMKESLLPLIITLAVTSIIDDLILIPLIQHYKTKYLASKVIDERKQEEINE